MTIWTILDWLLYGLVRYVLYWVPVLKAPRVDRGAPTEWWAYNTYSDWLHKDDDQGFPDDVWCSSWLEMAFGELAEYAKDKAKPYVDAAVTLLLSVIGAIPRRFLSMSSWVNWLNRLTGSLVPFFASSIGGATLWLYDRFPAGIRQGWQNWPDIWDNIKASVRSWARSQYDRAKGWAAHNLAWVNNVGDALERWRYRVADWIDTVRHDPRAWIVGVLGDGVNWLLAFALSPVSWVLGVLGPEWPRLLTFAGDCLDFYYSLWSRGWEILGQLVDDPEAWLMDRLEQAVMDRW